MTQKDYRKFAAMLASLDPEEPVIVVASRMADVFAEDNPCFKRDVFMKAANLA